MDVNQILYPVKEKYDMYDYNPKMYMSLGWMTDEIIIDLFINTEQNIIQQ